AATWGSMTDAFARGGVYISAPDPDRAYRSLTAHLITESNPDAVAVQLPGVRTTLDTNGYGTAAVLQLNDIVVVTESADAQKIAALATGGGATLAAYAPVTQEMAVP